jgi:hypothetical protein
MLRMLAYLLLHDRSRLCHAQGGATFLGLDKMLVTLS